MSGERDDRLEQLLSRGVRMPLPGTVYLGPEVNPDRISGKGVVIHPGCRITGKDTLIMAGTRLGEEAPVTLDNCRVGPDCRLKGGFFQGAVFAGQNSFGSGAHVRGGTILEEEACAAHTVGLKQTILFPFVTLGSLINFCDIFMAGGTSRKNHSEVGSAYIHFNYTPNQDKATASLLGDVPRGVLLDQSPIFLGGQGGLVGPRQLMFGTVTAAGIICRKDETRSDRLLYGGGMKGGSMPRTQNTVCQGVRQVYRKNIHYIRNLMALQAWYYHVRPLFAADEPARQLLLGMQETLEDCIRERLKRLDHYCSLLPAYRESLLSGGCSSGSGSVKAHDEVMAHWYKDQPRLTDEAFSHPPAAPPGELLEALSAGIRQHGRDYITVIQSLPGPARTLAIIWLSTQVEPVA